MENNNNSYAFGTSGDKECNWSIGYDAINDNSHVMFTIFGTYKKEDIIRILKEKTKEIDEHWGQTIYHERSKL
jgi:hypothetical protein